MTVDICQWKPEAVQRAVQIISQSKPAYSAMLPFFESVFAFQESAVGVAQPGLIEIEDTVLAAKQKGGLPLFERVHMPVDWPATHQLLGMMCNAADQANPHLAAVAEAIGKCLAQPGDVLEKSFLALLADDEQALNQSAAQLDLNSRILPFFLYNSLWPSVAVHARRLEGKLENTEAGTNGYCPMCGEVPILSLLGEDGQRVLVCSFCRHKWPVIRIFCPFCGATKGSDISYFFSEEEKEYRVHTCQSCLKYIKTVDTRQLQRDCYPPLEAVVTAHLDIKAMSMGFDSHVPSWWVL